MDEERFWAIIEQAWKKVGGATVARQRLIADQFTEADLMALLDALDDLMPALRKQLYPLTAEELLAFDRILERKLYDIDRVDMHTRTEGTAKEFLAIRGFIVAAGRACYEAVSANPELAVPELDCEELCYMPMRMYEKQFGKMPRSEISRETCSNAAQWPEGE